MLPRSFCLRAALGALCFGLLGVTTLRAQNDGSRLSHNQFDVDAPTVAAEEIDDYYKRRGDEDERLRNESFRASQACLNKTRAPANASAGAAPSANIRADLRDRSIQELALMYQQKPDPDVATAIQIRAAEGSAKRGLPPSSGTNQNGSPESRLLDRLGRQQAAANELSTQDCLAAVEQRSADAGEPLAPAFEQATFLLRKGKAQSVVVDFEGVLPGHAYRGYVQRFNIVSRSGPYGDKAVSMRQAQTASWHPQGIYWPDFATVLPAASHAAQKAASKSSPLDVVRALKDALRKSSEAPK